MTSVLKMACLAALALVLSCAGVLRPIGASPGDYADYRAFRVAPNLGARLKAASCYLRCRSDGAFYDEVAEWFSEIEPLYFAALSDSASGMQTYLNALPDGPHAEAATQRRDAMSSAARAEGGERLAARAAEIETRLAKAAESRENVLTVYATWIAQLLDSDVWGRAPEAGKSELALLWPAEPKPRCSAKRCTKLFSLHYELEVRGKAEPFVVILEVTLKMAKGKVTEATVSAPDLFSRLAEAHEAEPFSDSDDGRSRAVKYVVQLTSGAVERRLEKARCGRDATPPAVLLRECDGYRVELLPKSTTAEEDRVVIRGPRRL